MNVIFRTAALACGLACGADATGQTYSTNFEAPQFTAGDVAGQDGWGQLPNSPTRGAIEALPPGSPPALGTQGLAIRTRDVNLFGVSNHLASPIITPPAGETGAVAEGVPAPATNDYFLATFWYRTPSAPIVSTAASGRIAELDPSTRGPDADDPANRYAQVRVVNNANSAAGLVRIDIAWLTPPVTVADNLPWGTWFRFEYAIRTVDGDFGATPNDLFTLQIFDTAGNLVSSTAANTCGSTWELGYKTGGFGGGPGPRVINGFDFWSTTGPNDTLVGHVDGLSYQSVSLPDPALQIAFGDNQQGLPGSTLALPLGVSVANAPADQARCYPVTYTVQSTPPGATGAAVGTPLATPDASSGAASSTATLGDLAGTYTYSASSPLLAGSPVVFNAQAIVPAPLLSLQKVLSNAPANIVAGSTLSYTITASNDGNVPLTGVTVADPQLDTPNAACPSLAMGATCVLSGDHVVTPAEAQAGQVDNTATADSSETAPVQASVSTPVASADLSIIKVDGGVDFLPGGGIAYTLTVHDHGPAAAENVQLIDTLPAGTQFVSANGAGWACNFAADTLTCTRPALASGGDAAVALVVSVDAGHAGASIVNQASVSSGAFDPLPANNVASATTQAAQPGLALQKVLSTSPPYRVAGSVLGYTVTATNNGNITLGNVVVGDPALGPATANCTTLAPNATCVLTGNYTITAADVLAGSVSNTASADSNETAPVQATLVTPIARADVALLKEDGGVDFVPGGALDYTLAVRNNGPDTAEQLQVTDTLPASTQFVSASGAGWACVFNAGTVTCTRASLAAGAQSSIDLALDVAPGFAGTSITNLAGVSNAVADPAPGNNIDGETSNAILGGGPADLRVTDFANAASVSPGGILTYAVTVINVGVATAVNTVISNPTPAGLEFLDATAPCSGGFPCNVGDLANGERVTIFARYRVALDYSAPRVSQTASAAFDSPDPTPADNSATAEVAIDQLLPIASRVIPVPVDDRAMLALLALAIAAAAWLGGALRTAASPGARSGRANETGRSR